MGWDAGIPANGKFYAYAPFRMNSKKEANYGTFNVGVFVSDNVDGPYRDVFGGPMKDASGKPLEALSPSVVKRMAGTLLDMGIGRTERHEVEIARLQSGMTQLAEPPRKLEVPRKDACGNLEYFESPVLFKHGSTVCEYRAEWYLAYHLPYDNLLPYDDHHRQVAITHLRFNMDGTITPVNPDRDAGAGTPGNIRTDTRCVRTAP